MEKYFEQLQKNDLFKNFNEFDLKNILQCISAKICFYKKNNIILFQDDFFDFAGIVLSGSLQIIKEDIEGNINIIDSLYINDTFAEVLACNQIYKSPVTIKAIENCEILLFDCKKVLTICDKSCDFHLNLIKNLLLIIATKNIILNQKIEILSKRSIRKRIFAFFHSQILLNNSKIFSIPYNRDAFANYLCVDRSALSRELCNMQNEGLIRFSKNHFEILVDTVNCIT